MFKKYGVLGILLIILVELNFFFKIQPFASWYFPIIWFGYILVIDSLIYKLKKNSLISNRFGQFLGMLVLSIFIRWFLQIFTSYLNNWSYTGTGYIPSGPISFLYTILASATTLPALFETAELFITLHLFDKDKLHKKHKISKITIHVFIGIGVLCFILPFLFPRYAFPLVWLTFFFILDPINYLHHQPSIIGHLKDKKLKIPLSIILSGGIVGFFWEFWNYWSLHKWTYNIPIFGFFKIFEMPILGYFGYLTFALELYSMYWFIRSLFLHKEYLLAK